MEAKSIQMEVGYDQESRASTKSKSLDKKVFYGGRASLAKSWILVEYGRI